jgi:hypothetical protein
MAEPVTEPSRNSVKLNDDNDVMDLNALEDDSSDADSKDTILRRLKKALRLAGKLQTKLDFEKEVSKELARRNEQLKKDNDGQEEVYNTLKESFQEIYLQFDDLLVRYGTCCVYIIFVHDRCFVCIGCWMIAVSAHLDKST